MGKTIASLQAFLLTSAPFPSPSNVGFSGKSLCISQVMSCFLILQRKFAVLDIFYTSSP